MRDMDSFDLITLYEGELIDTYGGDFTYRDTGYIKNDDGTYSFYYRDYGAKPTDGWEEVDDPSEIEEMTNIVRNDEMKKSLIAAIENNEFIHGVATLRVDLTDSEGNVIAAKGEEGLITAYLPERKIFAVMFKGDKGWHTFEEDEEAFKDRCFVMLNENLN